MAVSTAFFCAPMENENNNPPKVNPYAAPVADEVGSPVVYRRATMVPQLRIVAICMIVQAGLELLFSGYLVAMSLFMPWAIAQQPPQNPLPPEEQQVFDIMFMVFGIGGAVLLVACIVRLVAGIMGLFYRGRTLGLVSHFLGLVSICSCYCMPTAIGVCVWGAIVYMNADVKRAFEMRSEGHKIAEIDEFFRNQ